MLHSDTYQSLVCDTKSPSAKFPLVLPGDTSSMFSGFLFGGVMDKLRVQDFRSAWLELINVGMAWWMRP